jgi:hypothetical protein
MVRESQIAVQKIGMQMILECASTLRWEIRWTGAQMGTMELGGADQPTLDRESCLFRAPTPFSNWANCCQNVVRRGPMRSPKC